MSKWYCLKKIITQLSLNLVQFHRNLFFLIISDCYYYYGKDCYCPSNLESLKFKKVISTTKKWIAKAFRILLRKERLTIYPTRNICASNRVWFYPYLTLLYLKIQLFSFTLQMSNFSSIKHTKKYAKTSHKSPWSGMT